MNARLRMRLLRQPAAPRVPIGAAALENADRAAYQSARTRIGCPLPPLPLTEAQAWAEAEQLGLLPPPTPTGA